MALATATKSDERSGGRQSKRENKMGKQENSKEKHKTGSA